MTNGTRTHEMRSGVMVMVSEPKHPDLPNFVIQCPYGDWSGFRTLAECRAQFAELESRVAKSGKPEEQNGFFWVIEH